MILYNAGKYPYFLKINNGTIKNVWGIELLYKGAFIIEIQF